jgi:hypothetical protein
MLTHAVIKISTLPSEFCGAQDRRSTSFEESQRIRKRDFYAEHNEKVEMISHDHRRPK